MPPWLLSRLALRRTAPASVTTLPLVVQRTLAGKRQGPGAGDCTALVVQPTALHAQASWLLKLPA